MSTSSSRTPAATWDVKRIREDFPILQRTVNGQPLLYLDNGASNQKPNQVLAAMDRYYQTTHANVHRGVHTLSQEATDLFEKARITIASFIGAKDPSEVIFTRGTTESINLIAYSFGLSQLQEGDEIMVSGMEHHSNIVPWQIVCAMKKAVVRVIPVSDEGTIDPAWVKENISVKTRLISIVHVSNALGTINPVKEVIDIAHEQNIPVMLDGAQAIAHMPVDVVALDADFYAFSSHKMYGPTGMGILYGKTSWLNLLPPWQGGGEMIEQVTWKGTTYNALPFKFEAGTPDIAGAIGLAAACDYINQYDRDELLAHEHALLEKCTALMTSIPGLRVIGNAKDKSSVFSFLINDLHPYDVGTLLDQQGIAVRTGHHCAQPLMDQYCIPGTIRASFAMYNTLEEVERLYTATKKAITILS